LEDFMRSWFGSVRAFAFAANSFMAWIAAFTLVHFMRHTAAPMLSGNLAQNLSIGSRLESANPLARWWMTNFSSASSIGSPA